MKFHFFYENQSLWKKFITLMKFHHSDEISSFWSSVKSFDEKFITLMNNRHINENWLLCKKLISMMYSLWINISILVGGDQISP